MPRKRKPAEGNNADINDPHTLVPSPTGRGKLRTGGKPGNKGGTGRPPNEFKNRMRECATRGATEAYLDKCLNGDFGPRFFMDALRYASENGYGKPTQAVEVTGAEGGPLEVTVTRRIVTPSANR